MEKLIMLLDIYEEEVVGIHSISDKITEKDESYLISKKFGFIKWLLVSNKIDVEKAKILKSGHTAELMDYLDFIDGTMDVRDYSYFDDYEQVLMLLSIQEEPISFLIDLLKKIRGFIPRMVERKIWRRFLFHLQKQIG